MVSNAKTPVMLLQELAAKKFLQSPEYSIVPGSAGTHKNEFYYKVMLERISAIGTGHSKQMAKHDAAQKALDKLAILGVYEPSEIVIKPPAIMPETESFTNNASTSMRFNSIGTLTELCVANKISLPSYREISEVGPPHSKEFTIGCKIATVLTQGTSGIKKHAKQLAAKAMLARIKNILPELTAICANNVAAVSETDEQTEEQAAAICCRLEKYKIPKPLIMNDCDDYAANINSIIAEKHLDINNLKKYFREPKTLETFKKFLDELELEYFIKPIKGYPVTVILNVSFDSHFAVLGNGENYQDAVQDAINKAFECMNNLFL